MSNVVNILRKMVDFDKAERLDGYSKVTIIVSDDVEYSAGTDTGRTLTLSCPLGTQQVANNILAQIRGYQYQPMTVGGGLVDPAAEIGDGISANNVYSGVFTQNITYNSNLPQDITAPADEELDEEFEYIPKTDRKIQRQYKEMQATFAVQASQIAAEVSAREAQGEQFKAQFQVQANQISAKVEKTGGSNNSFGWELTDSSWTLKSNGGTVLKASKDGLEVKGKITATSGKIGGFDIQSNYLSYNGQTWGGTNTYGAYLGTSGLQLGKNFKVDMSGNLTAASGTFTGSVNAGNIQYGGSAGYLSGSGLSDYSISGGKVAGYTLSTAKFTSGVNASLGYADYANGVFNGWNIPSRMIVNSLTVSSYLYYGNVQCTRRSVRVMTGENSYTTITYLAC